MALETASYISDLEPSNPAPTDQLRQADDHLRLIKQALLNTFPNITGPVTLTQAQINTPPFTIEPGIISLWFGAAVDCPAGWAICNGGTAPRSDGSGTITTPDLRGLTVMGSDGSHAPGALLGAPTATVASAASGGHTHTVDGGSHTHSGVTSATALTEAQMPPHRHQIAIAANGSGVVSSASSIYVTSTSGGDSEYSLDGAATEPTVGRTSSVGGGATHTHDLTIGSSTHVHAVSAADAHTHNVVVPTYQPTIALHYIMKT